MWELIFVTCFSPPHSDPLPSPISLLSHTFLMNPFSTCINPLLLPPSISSLLPSNQFPLSLPHTFCPLFFCPSQLIPSHSTLLHKSPFRGPSPALPPSLYFDSLVQACLTYMNQNWNKGVTQFRTYQHRLDILYRSFPPWNNKVAASQCLYSANLNTRSWLGLLPEDWLGYSSA